MARHRLGQKDGCGVADLQEDRTRETVIEPPGCHGDRLSAEMRTTQAAVRSPGDDHGAWPTLGKNPGRVST